VQGDDGLLILSEKNPMSFQYSFYPSIYLFNKFPTSNNNSKSKMLVVIGLDRILTMISQRGGIR
tara:strand:- start:6 stop:197 length:192 start_codon:yes stop_codon:yes gene_type:complete